MKKVKFYITETTVLFLLCIIPLPSIAGSLATEAVMPSFIDTEQDEDALIYELEFKDALLLDVIRVLAEQSGTNIIASKEANETRVTIYLKDVTVKEAIESICRINGLWYRQDGDNNTFRIMTVEQFKKDITVYKDEKLKVFRLLNPNTRIVAQAIQDLFGQRVILSLGLDPAQEQEFILGGAGGLGGLGGRGGLGGVGGRGNNRQNRGNFNNNNRRFNNNNNAFGGGQGAQGDTFIDESRQIQTELSTQQIEDLTSGDRIDASRLLEFTAQSSLIFVTVSNEHNQIIVRTSDQDAIDSIAKLISEMDQPVPQVLLEMKVLSVNLSDDFRSAGNLTTDIGTSDVIDPNTGDFFPSNSFLFGNFPLEGGTFVYQFISDRVLATLEILAQNNRLNVLSKPVILASNNRPAELFVGEEAVITTGVSSDVVTNQTNTTSFITPETEVRPVGNRITITPFINDDDSITLGLQQETSTVNENGGSIIVQDGLRGVTEVPIDTVDTATLTGTVVAKHGYTMAVGGLIRNTKGNTVEKVPILGDIPVVGMFFRREERIEQERELVLLVTPYVMRKGNDYEEVTRERVLKDSSYSEWEDDGVIPEVIKPKQTPPGSIEKDLRIFEENSIRPEGDQLRLKSDDQVSIDRFLNSLPAQQKTQQDPVKRLVEAAAVAMKPAGASNIPVRSNVPTPLFHNRKLVSYPEFTWKERELYVTKVRVKNISKVSVSLDPGGLRGSWLFARFESDAIAAAEETVGYLVSAEAYPASLAQDPNDLNINHIVSN